MTLSRNLIVGLINSIWTALISLAVVPFYLRYLGIEAYGLIGFFVTTQLLLQLLDMGIAPTINREVARCSAEGSIQSAGKLLHSLAVIYWGIAFLIAILVLLMAPLISEYWLQSKKLSPETISHAIMLMGLVIACRWPIGLYQGVLIGAHQLAISSIINMVMITISSVGAVCVLRFFSPTIESFFVWQAIVGLIYTFIIRIAAWKVVGSSSGHSFDIESLRKVLKFSLGAGSIALAGLVLTQLDKVILSKTVELVNFGQYMLATMLANSLYIIIIPIFNIVYPRFSSLTLKIGGDRLRSEYQISSRLLATLLFPLTMALILLAKPLIQLWTSNDMLAINVAPLTSILLAAYALHGVMHMPYALMLAEGEAGAMFKIYVALIAIIVPLTVVLSVGYGALGGAWAQLSLFSIYLIIGTYITHKRYLKGYALEWLLKDIGIPMAISVVVGVIGYLTLSRFKDEVYLELMIGTAFWVIATLLSGYRVRPTLLILWGQLQHQVRKGKHV